MLSNEEGPIVWHSREQMWSISRTVFFDSNLLQFLTLTKQNANVCDRNAQTRRVRQSQFPYVIEYVTKQDIVTYIRASTLSTINGNNNDNDDDDDDSKNCKIVAVVE